MATALVLILLGVAIVLRGPKLAAAALAWQETTVNADVDADAAAPPSGPSGPFAPPVVVGGPSRGRLPLPGVPSIPYPDVIDPSRKG